MSLQFGYRCALIAMVIMLARACLSGSDVASGLQSALLAMMVYFVVGLGIGELARRLILEAVDREMTILTTQAFGPDTHPPASS